jgi:hypothetical protein
MNEVSNMAGYYDREGNPLTMMEWAQKFGDMAYKRVAETKVGATWVSTV